jgi:hypothetical protein
MPEHTESYPEHRGGADPGSAVDHEESIVQRTGLFDRDWYVTNAPELGNNTDLVAHFCREGWQRGLQPNPYFHPTWYAQTYGTELAPHENPLLHYIRRGERENAWPSPHFDPEWYRQEYALSQNESPLRHYLLNRSAGTYSPLPVFDVAEYLASHPECLAAGQDPYLHWLRLPREASHSAPPGASPLAAIVRLIGGNLETGDIPEAVSWEVLKQVLRSFIPLIPFDEAWYCRCYPDVATAVKCHLIVSAHQHFIDYGFFEGRSPAPASD